VKRFLTREVEFFAPQLAFCFGGKAMRTFQNLVLPLVPNCQQVDLYHPSFIDKFAPTKGLTQGEAIAANDGWIRDFLERLT